jgi:hypothetical protein
MSGGDIKSAAPRDGPAREKMIAAAPADVLLPELTRIVCGYAPTALSRAPRGRSG